MPRSSCAATPSPASSSPPSTSSAASSSATSATTWTLGEAADVFVKLSVGDGLVTQIPALIVSLAAGLLVSKGGTRGSADKAVFGQLGAYPRALYVAAALLMLLALMPGLPFLPFVALGGAMAVARPTSSRASRAAAAQPRRRPRSRMPPDKADDEKNSVKESLKTAEIELCLGKQLSTQLLGAHQELAFRVGKMRQNSPGNTASSFPRSSSPTISRIPPKSYQIKIHGTRGRRT